MKKELVVLILLVSIFTVPIKLNNAEEPEIREAFNLTFLTPDTIDERVQVSLLLEVELAKIGIDVIYNNITGWGNIQSRTWGYPLIDYDYVPTYIEGGFDVVFTGWSWGNPWDPSGAYDTAGIVPYGDNFYQYSNTTYDDLLEDYLAETDETLKENYAHQMQAILYDDLPDICLYYESFNQIDFTRFQSMGFNMKHPYLGTGELTPNGTSEAARYVRKAISHAVPRDLIVSDIFGGEVLPGVTSCSPNMTVFDETLEPYEYNITLAREYMELAGFDIIGEEPEPTETPEDTGYNAISIFLISVIGVTVATIIRKRK